MAQELEAGCVINKAHADDFVKQGMVDIGLSEMCKPASNSLLRNLEAYTGSMVETARKKNSDYTGGDDPYANFRACEDIGLCSVEVGIMVRMVDKLMRMRAFVAKGTLEVKDESIEDTSLDLANYSLIFASYVKDKRAK
jgi:hypothetical protein